MSEHAVSALPFLDGRYDSTPIWRFQALQVRSGCLTCKARRVKCDEAKPTCQRCIKSGRNCEGYDTATRVRAPNGPLIIIAYFPGPDSSPSSQPDNDLQELRALDYFQHRAAPEFAGPFAMDLSSRFILLIANYEPAVKHAVVALATVHEEYVDAEGFSLDPSQLAMRHYGKAIQQVMKLNTSESQNAIDVALATCILFACLENLKGHYQSALSHIFSGFKIVEEEQRNRNMAQNECIPRVILQSLFMHIESQVMEIGDTILVQRAFSVHLTEPAIPEHFETTDQAILALEIINHRALHVMHRVDCHFTDPNVPKETFASTQMDKEEVHMRLKRWSTNFEQMMAKTVSPHSSRLHVNEPAVLVLKIVKAAIQILLEVDPANIEVEFDRFTKEFTDIVNWSEAYVRLTSTTAASPQPSRSLTPMSRKKSPSYQKPTTPESQFITKDDSPRQIVPKPELVIARSFSITMGCIPSLYLTAARCREPCIRRRALRLLQTCNRREGLWDATLVGRVAEQIILLEEANAQHQINALGTPTEVASASQVSKEARINSIDIQFGPEATGKIRYSMKSPAPGFNGSFGPFHGFKELLEW